MTIVISLPDRPLKRLRWIIRSGGGFGPWMMMYASESRVRVGLRFYPREFFIDVLWLHFGFGWQSDCRE